MMLVYATNGMTPMIVIATEAYPPTRKVSICATFIPLPLSRY